MAVQGSLTTTFGISASAPSAFTEVAYEAVSFTDCGEVTNVGEFGRMYEMVRINNLKGGATRKFKGSYDNGTFELELLFDRADAGQTLIEAAGDSTNTYYFEVGLPDGTEFYFSGLVSKVSRAIGGPNDAFRIMATVELDHNDIIEGT